MSCVSCPVLCLSVTCECQGLFFHFEHKTTSMMSMEGGAGQEVRDNTVTASEGQPN